VAALGWGWGSPVICTDGRGWQRHHDRITMNSRFVSKQGMMSTHQDNTNFIQLCISNALQEVGESENNRTNSLLMEDNSSKESDYYEHNSLLYYYLENDVTQHRNSSTEDKTFLQ